MKHSYKTYIFLLIIVILSVTLSLLMPVTEYFKGLFSIPIVISLVGALYQQLRDQALFEKQQHLEMQRRLFEIGATSHMANTAFDKHVHFCESYMKQIHYTLDTLFKFGPSANVIKHADSAYKVRQQYAAWLTDDINKSLQPFEDALREIGSSSLFINRTADSPRHTEEHAKVLREIYKKVIDVLGIEIGYQSNEAYAIEAVTKKIREILGIEELRKIRKHLIEEAISALEKKA